MGELLRDRVLRTLLDASFALTNLESSPSFHGVEESFQLAIGFRRDDIEFALARMETEPTWLPHLDAVTDCYRALAVLSAAAKDVGRRDMHKALQEAEYAMDSVRSALLMDGPKESPTHVSETRPRFDNTQRGVAYEHTLYETGDETAPDSIKDRNGEVVLGLCMVCGKGEVELQGPCGPETDYERAYRLLNTEASLLKALEVVRGQNSDTRVAEMFDYATAHRVWHEATPDGAMDPGSSEPMNEKRRQQIADARLVMDARNLVTSFADEVPVDWQESPKDTMRDFHDYLREELARLYRGKVNLFSEGATNEGELRQMFEDSLAHAHEVFSGRKSPEGEEG